MPSKVRDDDYLLFVGHFLEGRGHFTYMFDQKEEIIALSGDSSTARTIVGLSIPEYFHCIKGKDLYNGKSCINKSLLTRKNIKNIVDITGESLFWNAKDVQANCKKFLALCLGKNSPYQNFTGTFPSGTNYEDYLYWIRKEMYSIVKHVVVEDRVD